MAAERTAQTRPPRTLPELQEVLEQFVVSMELHIGAKLTHIKFTPEPTPSQEAPGLVARWTGRIDELGEQRFWGADAMPAWLGPDATCDTFSRVRLIVYLTWLYRAPRTLKVYDGEYSHGNDDGFGMSIERLCCGPDECDGSTLNEEYRPSLLRCPGMGADVAERDGHVDLQLGYSVLAETADEDWLVVEGAGPQARFMAMHFPCLPWPPLTRRVTGGQAPCDADQGSGSAGSDDD